MRRPSFRNAAFAFLILSGVSPLWAVDEPPRMRAGDVATVPSVAGYSAAKGVDILDAAASRAEPERTRFFPLHWAAIQDQEKVVTRLVARGMPVDARDADGRTPLMIAATFGNPAVARVLLTLGADPNARAFATGDAPIHFAARTGQTELVRLLLAHGVAPDMRVSATGMTALHYAAHFGHRGTIELLVTSGVDPDIADNIGIMPQQYASRRRRAEIVAFLRELGARPDNLHDAVNADDIERARTLILAGADVDAQGLHGTPLHLAAAKGHLWLLRMLVDAGADLEAEGEPEGAHPLHLAAINNQAEAAKLLIAAGAGLDARDEWGRTPLGVAAAFGNLSVADALLAGGADPLARDEVYGDTPLHIAASMGHVAVARLLLERGVDVNLPSGHDGEAPLHYAAQRVQLPMIRFLADSGADVNQQDADGVTPLFYAIRKTNHDSGPANILLRSLGARP